MTTPTDEAARIAQRVPEDIATERDLDLIDEIFSDDCVEYGPFGGEIQGRESVKAEMGAFLNAFPDFEAKVEDVVSDGEMVAMRVTLSGAHEGMFMGIEPTGAVFRVQNMVFTHVEDGMITERWLQPDTLGMLVQLGVIDSPVAAPTMGAGD